MTGRVAANQKQRIRLPFPEDINLRRLRLRGQSSGPITRVTPTLRGGPVRTSLPTKRG
jgi:hypothetical protein